MFSDQLPVGDDFFQPILPQATIFKDIAYIDTIRIACVGHTCIIFAFCFHVRTLYKESRDSKKVKKWSGIGRIQKGKCVSLF
jgi:hypothetical protein